MKAQILKIAGVKSEKEFYKKFPTEAAFKKAHGKEFKKAQLGASVAPEVGSYMGGERVSNPARINYNQLYDDIDLSLTGMNQQKRMDAQNLATQREIASKTGKGGGGGMQDLIKNFGSAASAMGGAKYGKQIKKAQGGLGLNNPAGGSMLNPNPDSNMWGSTPIGGQTATPANPYGQLPAYNQSQMGTFDQQAAASEGAVNPKSPWGNIAKGIPVVGKLVGAFAANKAEKKAMKMAEQTAGVSAISRKAADTRPEQIKRKYVRPEDALVQPGQMGSPYGTGTNYLARNGSLIGGNPTEIQNTYAPNNVLYDDLGYEPLENDEQVKQYRRGGLVRAQGGFSDFMTSAEGSAALEQAGTLAGGSNAGSQFGEAIGDAAGFIPGIGPVAKAVIKPIANLVGGLLDRKPKKTAAFKAQTQGNMENMAFTSGVRGLQGQNQAYMEDGGWVSHDWNPQVIAKFGDHTAEDYYDAGHEGMDSLRAGGHLTNYEAPSARALQTMAMGGELKTHWGGYAEPISYNPYLPDGGETVMFRGQSHDESDGRGNTGIGVTYGNKQQDSYTDYAEYGTEADADVEVERGEPAVKLKDGTSGEDSLVVYGNLKIPNQYLDIIGDKNAKGKKFKNYIKDLSKVEARQNKIMEKSLDIINNIDNRTAFGKLEEEANKANILGANMKLKEIAEKKQNTAALQSALNDTAAEYGVVADDLAKGKIKIDRSNNNMAKFGASLEKAQKGAKKKKAVVSDEPIAPYVGRGEFREDPDDANIYSKNKSEYFKPAGLTHEAVAKMMTERKINMPGKQLPGPKKDWTDTAMMAYNEALPYLRPGYKIEQPDFSSEMMAAGMNQMDPVQAQLFTPNLTQPYDVSFQDQLNANQADFNALQRMTGYNPAAQSALAAQKYAANSAILSGQFRANQAEKARAYEENRKLLDQAQLGNLGILDKQYERQATAKSKTKQQSIEIAKSISDKLAQAKKEQRMSDLEQQRYNFRFDANGRPINMNPLATFNMSGAGKSSLGGRGLASGKDFTYDRSGNIVGIRSLGKDELDETGKSGKNGTKIKARNSSIVKAIKNL